MKFSDLTPTHRSILAALVNGGPQSTDRLARVIGTSSAQLAATTLCQLRTIGLIYSREKGNDTYATWVANDIGLAVFNNRPADVPAPAIEAQCASNDEAADWIIYEEGMGSVRVNDSLRHAVLSKAQSRATAKPGTVFTVYRAVAVAAMPVPQAQITLL